MHLMSRLRMAVTQAFRIGTQQPAYLAISNNFQQPTHTCARHAKPAAALLVLPNVTAKAGPRSPLAQLVQLTAAFARQLA